MTVATVWIADESESSGRRVDLEAGGVLLLGEADAGIGARLLERGTPLSIGARRLDRHGPSGRVRAGLAVVDDRAPVAPDVSIADHLAAIRADAVDLLDTAPLLRGRGHEPAGVLSGGERRVLTWLLAVALRPRLVVLDGAGAGLDPVTLAWCDERVGVWTRAGAARIVRTGRSEERAWATGTPEGSGTS